MDCPWNSPGQYTGVGSQSLLQGIFPTQGSNPGLPHCRQILYQLSNQGSSALLVADKSQNIYKFCIQVILGKILCGNNGYYSGIKRNKIVPFAKTRIDLETIIQSEVSQKEKKQVLCNTACMWNLEKWYRSTCLQSRNRDTGIENKFMDTKGERESGVNWEIGIDIYTLLCVK